MSEATSCAAVVRGAYSQMREGINRYQGKGKVHKSTHDLSAVVAQLRDGAEQRKADPNAIHPVIIDAPFPPCKSALVELSPMGIAALRVETHHYGKVLYVRRFTDLVLGACVLACGVEDEHGDADIMRVECFNMPSADHLPHNYIIAIKEPYFKILDCVAESAAICVWHPSDIVFLPPYDDRVPLALQSPTPHADEAGVWKLQGDDALEQGSLIGALEAYTNGLKAEPCNGINTSDRAELLRSRALINIQLGHYQAAIDDATAAMLLQPGCDLDALRRAGVACEALQRFSEAHNFYRQMIQMAPDDETSQVDFLRSGDRAIEQHEGKYDLPALFDRYKAGQFHLDCASFVRKTESRQSSIAGRGLFANEPIKAGDLVLCEKAVICIFTSEPRAYKTQFLDTRRDKSFGCVWGVRYRELVNAVHGDPALLSEIVQLEARGYQSIPEEGEIVDGVPIVDAFHMYDILENNAFGFNTPESGLVKSLDAPLHTVDVRAPSGMGLWARASLANHACSPNAKRTHIGDLLVLKAARDIAVGEEITITYTYETDAEVKKQIFAEDYGFVCQCPECE